MPSLRLIWSTVCPLEDLVEELRVKTEDLVGSGGEVASFTPSEGCWPDLSDQEACWRVMVGLDHLAHIYREMHGFRLLGTL